MKYKHTYRHILSHVHGLCYNNRQKGREREESGVLKLMNGRERVHRLFHQGRTISVTSAKKKRHIFFIGTSMWQKNSHVLYLSRNLHKLFIYMKSLILRSARGSLGGGGLLGLWATPGDICEGKAHMPINSVGLSMQISGRRCTMYLNIHLIGVFRSVCVSYLLSRGSCGRKLWPHHWLLAGHHR